MDYRNYSRRLVDNLGLLSNLKGSVVHHWLVLTVIDEHSSSFWPLAESSSQRSLTANAAKSFFGKTSLVRKHAGLFRPAKMFLCVRVER